MKLIKGANLGKRAKILQAQQYMILAVLGATIFLGAAVAVVMKSINRISFSANVIIAQDQSIVAFSDTIRNIGICPRPSGSVYTDDEIKKCTPNSISTDSVPGSLRSEILENLASNTALESVANRNTTNCINPDSNPKKNYTYKELQDNYEKAQNNGTEEDLIKAVALIKSCSALRVIPEALPAFKNEEALLASVDKIFRISGTEPESLSPSEDTGVANYGVNLYTIPVRLSIESDAGTVNTLLDNVEKSIRNFNIDRATIEWSGNNKVEFQAQATAFYMTPSVLNILTNTIKAGGSKK